MADNYTYSLGYLRSRLRTMLNESTATFWTDAQLNDAINQAESYIAEQALCIQNIDTAQTAATTRTVSFSGFKVAGVEYVPPSGDPVSLKKITQSQVGRVKALGPFPQYFYEVGNATIGIEPKPNATYNLNLYINDFPTEMATDATVPSIPVHFRPLILPLAYSIARNKDRHRLSIDYAYSIFLNELNFMYQHYSVQRFDSTAELRR
jgi:hypothetical protein